MGRTLLLGLAAVMAMVVSAAALDAQQRGRRPAEEMLISYAQALAEVNHLRDELQAELAANENKVPAVMQEIRERGAEEIAGALESHGLTQDQYREITWRISVSDEYRRAFQEVLEKLASGEGDPEPGVASPLAAQDLFGELRSVTDGVYTEGQAEAGAGIFRTLCVECHSTADVTGRDFLHVWTDRPLYALWEFLTTRMPYGAPGSISAEQYAQVTAYILQLNRYPAGEEPLPHTPLDVASIDMVMPAEQDLSRR